MTQKQLAIETELSPSTVHYDVKDGAPVSSVGEYIAWRRINREARSSTSSGKPALANPDAKLVPSVGDSWADRIARAQRTERETHDAYLRALVAGEQGQLEKLLGCHARAMQAVAEVERIALDHKVVTGELLPFEKAVSIFREFILPLKAEIERLPVKARARANPSDPALAESVIKAEVRTILTRLSSFAEKHK
jgi:hypothetical protein